MSKLTKDKLLKRLKKFHKKGEYSKCLKTANKILKSHPKEYEIYVLKADSLCILGKYDEIGETICQFLKYSPKKVENYLTAIKYFDATKDQDLILSKIIEDGLKRHPDSYELLMQKLKILYYGDKFQESIMYIDSILENIRFQKDLMLYKAKLYKCLDEYDNVLKVYNELLEYSNDLDTILKKLETLKMLDKDDEVNEILNNMIEDEERKVDGLISKGFYYAGYDNQKAMESIDKAIKIDPENVYAYYGKATVLYNMDEIENALDALYDSIELDETLEDNPDFNLLFARLEFEYNTDVDEARRRLSKITFKDDVFDESMDLSASIVSSFFREHLEEEYGDDLLDIDDNSIFSEDINSESLKSFSLNNGTIEHVNFHKAENNKMVNQLVYTKKDSSLIDNLIKSGKIESREDVDLFDDIPEKRELETVKDYETALNDFYDLKGEEYFSEHEGYLWKLVESRPYMMWLLGYSNLLWDNNEKEKSIDVLKYMIKLNSEDNQGVRDLLLPRLLELNRIDEFDEYNKKYEYDDSSYKNYNHLLKAIKFNLKDTKLLNLFKVAHKSNIHILDYLIGKKNIPEILPDTYGRGSENEAIYYVSLAYSVWNNDEEAIEKLKELSTIKK